MVFEILLGLVLIVIVGSIIGIIATKGKDGEYWGGLDTRVMALVVFLAFIWIFSPVWVYRNDIETIDTGTSEEVSVLYTLKYNETEITESSSGGFFLLIFGSYSSRSNSYVEQEYNFMVQNDDGWIQPQSLSLNKSTEDHIYYKEDNSVDPAFIVETTYVTECHVITREPKGILLNLLYRKEVGDCIMNWSIDNATLSTEEYYFIVPEGSIRREYIVN